MNSSITYIKAVGIILMVLGHSGCSIPYIVPFIYMFHMPLFFFASGYCFKKKYLDTPFDFVWRRLRGIYFPYIKWSLLFLLFHNVFYYIYVYDSRYTLDDICAKSLTIMTTMNGHDNLLGGFWFLNALFWGTLIGYASLKVLKKVNFSILSLFVLTLITNKLALSVPLLNISSREIAAATIFLVGHYFACRNIVMFRYKMISLSFILTLLGTVYWNMGMDLHSYSNKIYPLYLLTSILATWSIYSILQFTNAENNILLKVLRYIGNHTIEILIWHFLSFKVISLLIIMIYDLPKETLSDHPVIVNYATKGWWLMYFALGLVIPIACIYTIQRIRNYVKK